MIYTTEGLVAAAKRSQFFPTSQNTFSDPGDLIAFANEEMMTKIVPAVMSVREDYFLSHLVKNIAYNVNHYALPERAIGNDFKDLYYLPNKTDILTRYSIPKVQLNRSQGMSGWVGYPSGFYMEGDEVVITPKPTNPSPVDALLFFYFQRPSQLVSTTSCAKITGVSSASGTTTFTVDTDLTTSLSVGSLVDFLSAKSPFRLWQMDVSITAITSTTIAVTTASVSDESGAMEPIVGDSICPAQTCNIPMIPQEFHPILAEMICYRVMKAIGAAQNLQLVASSIKDMMSGAFKLMSNRVEQQVDVIYDRNGFLNSVNSFGPQIIIR